MVLGTWCYFQRIAFDAEEPLPHRVFWWNPDAGVVYRELSRLADRLALRQSNLPPNWPNEQRGSGQAQRA